jgi:hypothetical protein
MKQPGTFIGSALVFCASTGLVLSLGALPEGDDLSVTVNSSRAFVIEGSGASIPKVFAGPENIKNRIELRDLPANTMGGLHLRTWHVDYAHRWEREVTLPIVSGPLVKEGSNVCGFTLKIGAGLFANKEAIEGIIRKKLETKFPFKFRHDSGIEVDFPALRTVKLEVKLARGFVTVDLRLRLYDDTLIQAIANLKVVSSNGAPVVKRIGDVWTNWRGPTYDQMLEQAEEKGAVGGGLLGALFGFLIAGPAGAFVGGAAGGVGGSAYGQEKAHEEGQKEAQKTVTEQLDDALADLAFGMAKLKQPFAPLPLRPNDTVALSLAKDPTISPEGIAIPICSKVNIGGSKRDPAITGPVLVEPLNAFDTQLASFDGLSSDLELIANASGINEVLYLLWQSGTLRELGQSSAILDALPESIRALAFDVTGFDPGLPPTVAQSLSPSETKNLTVVLGDVTLGTWEQRRVVGHAVTSLGIDQGDNIDLFAKFEHLAVNCVESISRSAQMKLTPCLSDLLPPVRDMLKEKPLMHRMPSADLLRRLPNFTFEGLKIDLSKLRVITTSAPATLRFRVDTKIRAIP